MQNTNKNSIKLEPRERRIVLITGYGHFLSHFNMLIFPALVFPLMSILHTDISHVLEASFWMYLLFGITALPWGMAADKWGGRFLLKLFFFGTAASSFTAAFFTDSFVGLSLSLAALGLFSGILHPVGLGLISKELKHVSLGMGYNGMFGILGLTLAPLLTGIINWLIGVEAVYIFAAGLNILGLVAMPLLPGSEPKEPSENKSMRENGNLVPFLILLVAMMIGGTIYRGATVILPTYLELKTTEIYQWLLSFSGNDFSQNLLATVLTSLIYFVGMGGQYFGGRMAEKYDPKYPYLIFNLIPVPFAFLIAQVTDMPLILLSLVYFFFLLGMQPSENTLVARFTPKNLHHSAYGLKFVLTFGIGSLAVKMITFIEANKGIDFVFISQSALSSLLVLVILLLIYQLSTYSAKTNKN